MNDISPLPEAPFDETRWRPRLPELARQYAANQPFPWILLPDFLPDEPARRMAREFPRPDESEWIHYKHYNENKLGANKRDLFPPTIRAVVDSLNSPPFVVWLSELTGIPDLMADPDLDGGGLHQTERGGFLNIHADFTMHHYQSNWLRRVNLIVYLNETWQEDWGGALELWDVAMQQCVCRVPPLFNHAIIFDTSEQSYHGYPEPLTCPPDETRKSLALYYYTQVEGRTARSTNYRARPGDGAKAALIWLDKTLLAGYSKIKKRLGLSDDFASRVLRWLSRRSS